MPQHVNQISMKKDNKLCNKAHLKFFIRRQHKSNLPAQHYRHFGNPLGEIPNNFLNDNNIESLLEF